MLRFEGSDGWEPGVYLDETNFAGGGGFNNPSCRSCKQPILEGERSMRITFATDASGAQGLTGDYHATCGKPFDSLARALNVMSRFGR